ncbi:MAG: universal stress protein [Methanomicrobia archaeon]|nr:universal stress protein [Methanomicrobia archaeon]
MVRGDTSYRKIVSAVDGSFHSELAARHAIAIATSCGSELIVLAVDTGEVEREDLSAAVERVCHQAGGCGIHPSGAVRSGEVVKTILDAVTGEHADLVVAATRRGDHRFFVRSITQKLMLKAPCSVLAVKPAGIAKRGKSMLVPVAHRENNPGERILLTSSLAAYYHYQVELLHVVERQHWYYLPTEKLQKLRRYGEGNMMPVTKALKEKGVPVEMRAVVASSSTTAILKEAAIGRHTLVLVGASRRGVLKQVVAGNPIEELLSHILCDVLVWRPQP